MNGCNILITSGGTREAIDGVRYIGNFSTGATGALLADALVQQGHQVTLLHGTGAVLPHSQNIKLFCFTDYHSLKNQLENTLKQNSFDLVVMAAAVADYTVAGVRVGDQNFLPHHLDTQKITGTHEITLQLKPTAKLVTQISTWSQQGNQPAPVVVAFKLTRNAPVQEQQQAISKLAQQAGVDYVIHNDLALISAEKHPAQLYEKEQKIAECNYKNELPELIQKIISRRRQL